MMIAVCTTPRPKGICQTTQ
jgi:hypothetical protein